MTYNDKQNTILRNSQRTWDDLKSAGWESCYSTCDTGCVIVTRHEHHLIWISCWAVYVNKNKTHR